MFSGLGEERIIFRKKKKRKKKGKKRKQKRKNLIAANSGLVGMKECLKTYNHVKCFAVSMSLLNKTCFYAKLMGQFSGPKTKVTGHIASKFGTYMQLINLKQWSKFQVAKTNRSGVISKSLKLCTR